MKEYEVIWEIFNKCPRNQMRDVFVEEVASFPLAQPAQTRINTGLFKKSKDN